MSLHSSHIDAGLKARLAGLDTVADKIRLLNNAGMKRADIARLLDKRYQHVRNVLERDAAKQPKTVAAEGTEATSATYLKVAADGSVLIPSDMARAAGWRSGQALHASLGEGAVQILPVDVAVERLQALVASFDNGDVSPVDELIAERRAEAGRE